MKQKIFKKHIVILLAHGSPESYMKKVVISLQKKLSNELTKKNCTVKYAFLQFNKPKLKDSLVKILNSQLKTKNLKIIILPLFISHGRHTLFDLPKITKDIKRLFKNYKDVCLKVALPLGSDNLVVKLLYKRYKEAKGW